MDDGLIVVVHDVLLVVAAIAVAGDCFGVVVVLVIVVMVVDGSLLKQCVHTEGSYGRCGVGAWSGYSPVNFCIKWLL